MLLGTFYAGNQTISDLFIVGINAMEDEAV